MALQTNMEPFSRREIINEFATQTEKTTSVIDYVWNLSSPPMFDSDFGAVKRVYEPFTGAKTREGFEIVKGPKGPNAKIVRVLEGVSAR